MAITAHGVGPQVLDDVKATGAEVIDGTCPIVTRSQRWARRMAEQGFTVLVFGDPEHREVRGVLGWAGDKAVPVRDGEPLPRPVPEPRGDHQPDDADARSASRTSSRR